MPDDVSEDERRLRKLAARTRMHWEQTQPATQEELQAVRDAVRGQWEFEQGVKQRTRHAGEAAQQVKTDEEIRAEEERRKQEEEQHRKDQSHGHGHGF